MPQIDFLNYPFASQLFWLFLNFGILYFALSKFIVPKFSRIKSDRANLSKSALEEAQKLRTEAEKAKSGSETVASEARAKAIAFYQESESKITELKSAAASEISEYNNNLERTFSLETEEQINLTKPVIRSSALEIAKFILESKFSLKIKDSELTKHSSN